MAKGKEKIQWKNQLVNLVAIIIGVYIAFYITERASATKDHRQAKVFLAAMADDLEEDISSLTESTDTLRYYTKVLQALTRSVVTKRIPKDSLNDMISGLYLIVPFNPKDNSYQSLLASGKLELVGDFDLRRKITALYHQHYGAIRITDDISNQMRIQLITPFLMERMRFSSSGLVNAEELWRDNMFVNMSFSMHYSMLMKYRADSVALVHAKELKQLIEEELK